MSHYFDSNLQITYQGPDSKIVLTMLFPVFRKILGCISRFLTVRKRRKKL